MPGIDRIACITVAVKDQDEALKWYTEKLGVTNVRANRMVFLFLLFLGFPLISPCQAPVYEITPVSSSIQFDVESSVAIKGVFSRWNASLTFQTRELSTCVLDIKIEADSVDTGSGLKNGKLRGKNFFNAKESPYITFRSTKVTQTGPATFEVEGDFTIRGVTKKEKLLVNDDGKGLPSGTIIGTMAFDRKDYGMNSGIPFIRIADRVQVDISLKWKRVAGLPPAFQQ